MKLNTKGCGTCAAAFYFEYISSDTLTNSYPLFNKSGIILRIAAGVGDGAPPIKS